MIITDSGKIFLRTSGAVWRLLPYLLVCLLVLVGVTVAACYPMIASLNDAGFFTQVADLFETTMFNIRLDEIFGSMSTLLVSLGDLIAANIATFVPLIIVAVVILGAGGSFLIGLSDLALADYVYSYMSSNSRLSFGSCLIKNLGKSAKLQLAKLCVVWPVDLIITAIFIASFLLFTVNSTIITLLAPFIIVLLLVVLISLRQTLFCLWTPCMMTFNSSPFGALKENFAALKKHFNIVFPRQLVMTVIYIGVNIAVCIFTASVGLLLTVPATVLFAAILAQTTLCTTNGLRYYIDENEIITPKKREEREKADNLKDVM